MTDVTVKKQEKKPRQKRLSLNKLAIALQEANAAIADVPDIQLDDINLIRLNSALAKAAAGIAADINVPASKLKLSVTLSGDTPAKRAA
jgi:hypothetical protein